MDLDPKDVDDVVSHEKSTLDQMKRGDLDYDNENVYWKGKTYSRADMEEGAKNLPWEAEAYKKIMSKKRNLTKLKSVSF